MFSQSSGYDDGQSHNQKPLVSCLVMIVGFFVFMSILSSDKFTELYKMLFGVCWVIMSIWSMFWARK